MSDSAEEKISSIEADLPDTLPSHLSRSLSPDNVYDDPFADTFGGVDPSSIDPTDIDNHHTIPFFMGGDRRAVLDEVMHLCQFSNNLVAVLGEAGVGKTALTYQAIYELNDTAQCCLVQSSVMVGAEDVFRQIAQQIGALVPNSNNIYELIQALGKHQPSNMHQRVVIVVDDAHHLNDDVLGAFIHLLQEQSSHHFHVLLVGDSSLLLRLDEVDKGEILAYDIPLCPFTVDELADYLEFKLSVVGYQGIEVFDYDTVQTIWRNTRGIPASVNKVAQQLLLSHNMDDDEQRLGLPMGYMAVVVFLLAVLIMALFYVGDDAPSVEEVVEKPLVQKGETITSLGTKSTDVVKSETIEKTVDEVVLAPKKAIIAPAPIPKDVVKIAVEAVKPEEKKIEKPVSPPKPLIPEATPAKIKLPVKKPVASAPPSIPAVTSTDKPSSILTRDEEAVMFWPSGGYTLQVMAAGQREGIEKFVAAQSNRNVLRVVTFTRNNAPWYTVLVGVYRSTEEARLAIKTLPRGQISAKPWPRKISDVQRKIEDFRRK